MNEWYLKKIREQGYFEVDLRRYGAPEGAYAHEYISAYDESSMVTIERAYMAIDAYNGGQWECTAYYTSDGKKWFEATDGNPASEIVEDVAGCERFVYDLERGFLADGQPICPEGYY